MSIISSIPPPRKWNHKHIILVTLIGCLVLNAITAAISISLSPAHIFFSIRNATISDYSKDQDTKFYNFTLAANNTSPRMAVHYVSLSAEIWNTATTWVPAEVDRSSLQDQGTMQPPGNVTDINVCAEYWQSEQKSTPATPAVGGGQGNTPPPAAAGDDCSNCTVLVMASVWFKSRWWIGTRTYDVRANCSQVDFGNHTAIVDCKS
ncbi:hypothetical protein HU200_059476 [Digitaria exilis]|uniref:Uncharacterized protein n=1 Tax=Digitaria exilis TaxID=1010633 RepID=A0A835A7V2_9POAL|nr:hypothetical protein HU200_059476 [Digitaria exilis]